ncbi:hypothetical protein F7U66_01525 [Vibrio parahaemolyticus]|nr:hypothetical protein [Vibrio parahaemolyticus]
MEIYTNNDLHGEPIQMLLDMNTFGCVDSVSIVDQSGKKCVHETGGQFIERIRLAMEVLDFFNNKCGLLSGDEISSAWEVYRKYGANDFWQNYH